MTKKNLVPRLPCNFYSPIRNVIAVLLIGCVGGLADEVFVAPDGNDEASGDIQAPYRTLAAAAKMAGRGGTIWMRGGVYAERQMVTGKFDDTNPLLIKAWKDERPVIRNARDLPAEFMAEGGCYSIDMGDPVIGLLQDIGTNPFVQTPFDSCAEKSQVEAGNPSFCWDQKTFKLYVNLERKGEDPNAHQMVACLLADGLDIVNAENVVVEGLTIERAGNLAFSVNNCRGITLRRCRAFDSARLALGIDKSSEVTVEKCVFARAFNAVQIDESSNVTITHCVVAFTRAYGLQINQGNADLKVVNNVLHAGGPSGPTYGFTAPVNNSVFDFNLLHTCHKGRDAFSVVDTTLKPPTQQSLAGYQKETGREAHSTCGAPKFVSTEVGKENFALTPDSPGIGKAQDGRNCGVAP